MPVNFGVTIDDKFLFRLLRDEVDDLRLRAVKHHNLAIEAAIDSSQRQFSIIEF